MTLPLFVLSAHRATVTEFAAGYFDWIGSGTNALQAVNLDYTTSYIRVIGDASQTTLGDFDVSAEALSSGWIRLSFWSGIISAQSTTIGFFSLFGATTELLRLRAVGATSQLWRCEWWDGSSWVQIGTDVNTPQGIGDEEKVIDIQWIIANSGGAFRFYVNGTLNGEVTGDTLVTADTTIDTVRLRALHTTANAINFFYNMVIDDTDTRGLFVDEQLATSDGTETAWAGSETNIDERIGEASTADLITGSSVGLRETFNFNTINAALAGATVEAVYLAHVSKAVSDPGFDIRSICRVGSTTYDDGEVVTPLSVDWRPYATGHFVNPATTVAWSQAEVNSAQWGVKTE